MFLWCLSHDLRGDRVSSSGRAVHSGSRDTTVLMENNEGSYLFAKLKEAAALWILLPQGPASPLFPMGQVRPANEPCLKPSGEWAFLMCNWLFCSQAQTDSNYTLGRSCQGHVEFAHPGSPSCSVLTPLKVRGKQVIREAAECCQGGLSPPPLTGLGSSTSVCSSFTSVKWE